MLSYKLKHLCSRVIASLSIFGFMSITSGGVNHAFAAEQKVDGIGTSGNGYKVGDKVVWMQLSNKELVAQYVKMAGCSEQNDEGESVNATVTQSEGSIPGMTLCSYVCADGNVWVNSDRTSEYKGGKSYEVSGMEAVVPSGKCMSPQPTCNVDSSKYKNVTAKVTKDTNGSGYYCAYSCSQGYSKAGGKDSTTSWKSSTGVGVIEATQGCSVRTFDVTFDCESGRIVENGQSLGVQTKTYTATYGQQFEIKAYCSPYSGMTFDGWSGYIGELVQ